MVVMSEVAVAVEGSNLTHAAPEARIHAPNVPCGVPSIPWVSSLGQEELSWLLSVIENHVLPRLIADYAPGKHSSLANSIDPRR